MQEYNCQGSVDSSYGASAYSTCTSQVGAPDTGALQSFLASGSLGIILPLGVVVILVSVITIVRRRKART